MATPATEAWGQSSVTRNVGANHSRDQGEKTKRGYGVGMPRSLQIFIASLLRISVWRGTVVVLWFAGFDIYGMLLTFLEELAAMLLEMPQQLMAFHQVATIRSSRMTSLPSRSRSASLRFASMISITASLRFSRASSSVLP